MVSMPGRHYAVQRDSGKVRLKGTGGCFRNCGGSCTCNTVSDKPGTCKCGMRLKRFG